MTHPTHTKTITACSACLLVFLSGVLSLAHADADPNKSPALCGHADTPEPGIQGDIVTAPATGYNCGLTLLTIIPGGGSVAGSGHCGYVRYPGTLPYTGADIYAYSLADPKNPVLTNQVTSVGGSESMRGKTVDGRAILVSGRGVYDISDCEKLAKKGEIPWPSAAAQAGVYIAATNSHELGVSHDAKRVYSGLGFAAAYIEDLEHPETWVVKNNSCQLAKQGGYLAYQGLDDPCKTAPQGDYAPAFSHSSDDNAEGTRWYGANQCGSNAPQADECPPHARIVDITDPDHVKVLDSVPNFPGHSMNWWRTPDGKEFIIGANEANSESRCDAYPRPTSLGDALDAHIVEVTGDRFGIPFPLTVAINRPENCAAATASGAKAALSEYSLYNKNGAAFVMMEFAGPGAGGAGLRVFDLRDGYHPKEVAYFNNNQGYVHSAQFFYNDARGYILASGTNGMQVLELQPQAIRALGLPYPTDPAYPFDAADWTPNTPPTASLSPASTTVRAGETVTFTVVASDPDGDSVSYDLDFGDGPTQHATGTVGGTVTHTYSTASNTPYTATLTVTDWRYASTTATSQVTVQKATKRPRK